MNILVTGSNGQLGNEMRIVSRDSADRYVFTDVTDFPGNETVYLDITDVDAVRAAVAEYDIDVIVNCAAYTNVDKAETDVDTCRLLNAKSPENLAVAVREKGGILIHVSTDYVFGGEVYDSPLTEQTPTSPTGVYGLTKLEGEELIRNSGCRYIIIRTSWLYSEFGRNFVKTMLHLTATKPELKVVNDQKGTPTYALDLAAVIFDILENRMAEGREGIYHYSNEGACSWYEFAKTIAEYSGNVECEINPCTSEEYPSSVRRPSYSVLDKGRIKDVFGISVPCWTDSLKKCLNNI
jgi:dTDP-4-dehydrorhamnose reductase